MAKKAILDVLEHTIGRYVRNLDAESLNVAVWSGEIELRNLELDVDGVNRELRRRERAAPNLAVFPVRVAGGRFGSLTVDVPWARITSRPVVLRARGLTVSLRPRGDDDDDDDGQNDDDDGRNDDGARADSGGRSRRRAAVEDAEKERRVLNAVRRLATSDERDGAESKESGFSEKLVRRVVENLQFEVSDVRLELKGRGADAGVVLESLSLVTTDDKGNRTFVDRTERKNSSSFLFKALDIRGLGVFLNDLTRVDGGAVTEETRSWILSPLSFSATLRQSDSVRCVDFPKYLVRSRLSNLALSLSRPQLEALRRLTTVVAPADRIRPLFPQYRPDLPLSRDSAALYWRYAFRCVGRLTRRSSWKEFFLAFRKRQVYVPLYKRHAHAAECKWMKPLDSRELARLENIDDDPSVSAEGLMGWRNMADAQADRERAHFETTKQAKVKKKPSGSGGLFGSLFRDDKAKTTSSVERESEAPIKLSTEEMKELERLYLERASDADLSVDSILCDVQFSLQSLEMRLDNSDRRPLARFVMGTVSTSLKANNDGSYHGRYTLTDVRLEDLVTRDTLFPCVVRNVTEDNEDEGEDGRRRDGGDEGRYALAFTIDGKSSGDQEVSLHMVALELVAAPELLLEVKRFFEPPSSHDINKHPYLYASTSTRNVTKFYDPADEPLDDTSPRSADLLAGALSDAWNQKRERSARWTVDLRVRSPIVVLPRDPADPGGAVLVFDAGRFRATYGLRDESSSSELVDSWFGDRLPPQRVREDVDQWTIESRDAQLALGETGTWRTRAPLYVVEPTSASLQGGTETAASASNQRPLTCVFGVSKSLVVTMSPTRLQRIRELIDAWTKVGDRLGLTKEEEEEEEDEEEENQGAEILLAESPVPPQRHRTTPVAKQHNDDESTSDPRPWLHVSFALQRLSARFDLEELTEAVVFQGGFDIDTDLKADSSLKLNFQTVGVQFYTMEGTNLRRRVQILEPTDMVLVLTKTVASDFCEEIKLKFEALSEIDATVSMRNLALVHAISVSVNESFNQTTEARTNLDESVHLSKAEVKRLERMSLVMTKETQWENEANSQTIRSSEQPLNAASLSASDQKRTVGQFCRVNVTLSRTTLTIVNDLQGLDQALFLLRFNNVAFGGEYNTLMKTPLDSATPDTSVAIASTNSNRGPTWDIHLSVNILADYFDISTNLWEQFLLQPWEVNTSLVRCEEKKSSTGRMMTALDVESHPCHVSFSEQFLVGLGTASRMWSVYSTATANAVRPDGNDNGDRMALERKSMAANAALSLITTMPYGIINRTGLTNVEFSVSNDDDAGRTLCSPGSVRYFRFESPRAKGVGGKRLYGQHVAHHRALTIFVGTHALRFDHIDDEVNRPRRAHDLGEGRRIITDVVNTGKATMVYLYSHIHVHNQTNIPFSIATQNQDGIKDVGVCHGRARSEGQHKKLMSLSDDQANHVSLKYPCSLGIPADLLPNLTAESRNTSEFDLLLCPHMSDPNFNCLEDTPPRAAASLLGNGGSFGWGAISLPSVPRLIEIATQSNPMESMEVTCSMSNDEMNVRSVGIPVGTTTTTNDPVCLQVCVKVTLVANSLPFVEVFLQPRTLLKNQLPVSLLIRTPMKHTFSPPNTTGVCVHSAFDLHDHATHRLEPEQSMEVFTPGHSIAITCKCADSPTAGHVTGWAEGWIDVPLGEKCRLTEPLQGMFPFVDLSVNGGSTFCVVESTFTSMEKSGGKQDGNGSKLVRQNPADLVRNILINVDNFVVDHTKRNLFELKVNEKLIPLKKKQPTEENFTPWSAFASPRSGYRVTLLPKSSVLFCLIEESIDLDSGMRKSLPFKVNDLSISNGGVESNEIFWEDKTPSGLFAYRKLGSLGQSEVHVIPEFVVFNGSDQNTIQIKQPRSNHFDLEPGKIAPLSRDSARNLIMMIEVVELGGCTSPLQVDSLGMKICVVKSTHSGAPLGSIAIQTDIGALDSRIVVKVGPVAFSGEELKSKVLDSDRSRSIILDDFLRFRVRWAELQISLCDTQLAAETNKARLEMDMMKRELSTYVGVAESPVVKLLFHRVTVDFQRIFKKAKGTAMEDAIRPPEQSKLAIIVHNMRILDCVRGSPHPVVFDGFTDQNIFDLCVRFRGPINEDLIKVELVDLHLAWSNTSSDLIAISASEEFIWRVLDVINRIISATSELAGQQMELNWDSENTEFAVSVVDTDDRIYFGDGNVDYKPPQSDLLLDVKTAQVSPINLLISFKRDPQASRYNTDTGEAPGAKLTHFITTQLKFTIEKAKLKFPGYIARNIKGPPDLLLEPFMLFYIAGVKKRLFNLIAAVSIQDWKFLTNRDEGDDEFLEGDILRAGGNVIGSSAGLAVMSVGAGVGDGLSKLTDSIGNKVERSAAAIGAGAVGSRVNALVSGLGEGVGSTVKGVGTGAGDLVRGTGKGVGQIAGGLTGGVSVIGKGIAEGIQKRDGKKVLGSFADGAAAVGGGVKGGLGTTVKGIGSGVVNVGEGLFSGVKSIGKGIGGSKREDSQQRRK